MLTRDSKRPLHTCFPACHGNGANIPFAAECYGMAYVPKLEMKKQVASDIRSIFNAPEKQSALALLDRVASFYQKSAPQFLSWLLENIPHGLNAYDYPEKIRHKLRTSNLMGNIKKQIKRRTRVAGLFPNTNSMVRLVSALLQQISDEWETG